MKTLVNLFISLIIAAWIGAIAVFSIQNITPVSLKFLAFESIKFPAGVLLSFCLGGGIVFGATAPLLIGKPKPRRFVQKDEDLEEFGFD
ncbi:MAG: lipopolysaccharide assembly protein LapA domain-containing protein [Microcystaceae cyanobacterium]